MSYLNQMYEKGNVSIREEKNTANVPFAKSLRIFIAMVVFLCFESYILQSNIISR